MMADHLTPFTSWYILVLISETNDGKSSDPYAAEVAVHCTARSSFLFLEPETADDLNWPQVQ